MHSTRERVGEFVADGPRERRRHRQQGVSEAVGRVFRWEHRIEDRDYRRLQDSFDYTRS